MAIFSERDRLARDLHDTVIQRLFAVGLSLQGMAGRAVTKGRSTGSMMPSPALTTPSARSGPRSSNLVSTAPARDRELPSSPWLPNCTLSSASKSTRRSTDRSTHPLTNEVVDHLLATLREALTNIGRHAEATGKRHPRSGRRLMSP